jgi:hypothetical protein
MAKTGKGDLNQINRAPPIVQGRCDVLQRPLTEVNGSPAGDDTHW